MIRMHPHSVFPTAWGRRAMASMIIAAGLTLLPAMLLCVDYAARARRQVHTAEHWMRELDLSAPAFWPSGTALRHPETVLRAVDLRHAPSLPLPLSPHQRFDKQGVGAP